MSGYIGNIPTPQATQTRDTFTATAGQTTFATSGYTPSFLDVFLNGVHLVNGTDYTASNGSDVVLTSGAAAGDTLEVVAYSTFEASDVTASSGFTVTGNLSVDGGTIKLDGNYPVGTANVALGDAALSSNVTGVNNIAIGHQALYSNTTSSASTAVGYRAGWLSTAYVTAIGSNALGANTTGAENVAVGSNNPLGANTTGGNNTAMGSFALRNNTTAGNNSAFGKNALYANTTGASNTAVGSLALQNNTTASNNTAVGYQALYANTTGTQNVSMGAYALDANTTGTRNTVIGYNAMGANTASTANVAIGDHALLAKTSTGNDNVAIGTYAGSGLTTGSNSTFVGAGAGSSITTGDKNTILGRYNGNQGGLDIRTANNQIVLSDGNGNPRARCDSVGSWYNISATNGAIYWGESNNASYNSVGCHIRVNRTSSGIYYFYSAYDMAASTYRFIVDDNGNVRNVNNSYGAISDQRLKENISDASSQWDDIKSIKVRKYSLIEEASNEATQIGVIAQELEASGMSGLVEETPDRDENGVLLDTTTKQVKYSILYMKAVKALQEAMERIEQLEADVAALKNP